jgi:hypothetical protein
LAPVADHECEVNVFRRPSCVDAVGVHQQQITRLRADKEQVALSSDDLYIRNQPTKPNQLRFFAQIERDSGHE